MKRPERYIKYLNRTLNVGILLACLLLATGLAQRHKLSKQERGRMISVEGVDFSQSKKTLLLFLQSDCETCIRSLPFYKGLGDSLQDPAKIQLILITPHQTEVAGKFFKDAGVSFRTILQADSGLLGVKLTPTLILADSSGTVWGSWIGQLSPEREKEMWTMLEK
jgi:hypothetical protein